jgi:pimeloyl-ACP methyl ester carboxylesterase
VPASDTSWRDVWVRAPDGLDLYARDYGPPHGGPTPVLCLSGLTRNSKDAQPFAEHIAPTRRRIAPDYRGRGRSAYAPDWSSYSVEVEMADVVALLDKLGLDKVVVVGTSRGGLIAMLMAALHRDRLAGVLLNDIGPVLEPAGLLRIRRYLGRRLRVTTWRGAVAGLKRDNPGFESLEEAQWLAFARRVYRDEGGRPALDYDPDLRRTFPTPARIAASAVPPMWDLLTGLEGLPVAALRGEHSDLLSAQTHARMAETVEKLDAVTVRNRGHSPFLDEPESVAAVHRLLARCP